MGWINKIITTQKSVLSMGWIDQNAGICIIYWLDRSDCRNLYLRNRRIINVFPLWLELSKVEAYLPLHI